MSGACVDYGVAGHSAAGPDCQPQICADQGYGKREPSAAFQFPRIAITAAVAGVFRCMRRMWRNAIYKIAYTIVWRAYGCGQCYRMFVDMGCRFPIYAILCKFPRHGPAWGNSLFEDNAEYGYGIALGIRHRRERLADLLADMRDKSSSPELVKAIDLWLSEKTMRSNRFAAAETLRPLLPVGSEAAALSDLLVKNPCGR